jgi:hypothetical protein
VILACLLREESDAEVFVALLHTDGLWGDVSVILVLGSAGDWIVERG